MHVLKIALSGVAEDDAAQFQAALAGLDPQLSQLWLWADESGADLIVVDTDSVWGHMAWLRATGTGKRTALYTEAVHTQDSDLVLAKPLDPQAFAAVLAQVAGERGMPVGDGVRAAHRAAAEAARAASEPAAPSEAPAANVEDAAPAPVTEPHAAAPAPAAPAQPVLAEPAPPAAEPAAAETETPPPSSIGGMLRARRLDGPSRAAAGATTLIFDPERDAYYGEAMLKPLKALFDLPPDALTPVDADALARARQGQAHPLARLRWFAALSATPGALAAGLDPQASYKLTRWPQIEREFPRHFRIATAMMKQAGTLAAIAEASGAPVEDVADFVNAHHALGYVAVEGAAADGGDGQRGLLARMRLR
ncbi:MAG: hypothetical protein ABFC67_09115 [Mizugakiibacter sp.]|uniref:hypothetical protein n=1 Tax=Mizugakiibacter sp. TaxID=1972610 RepID=UPI0031CBA1B1|nr:hypothetical protein [Xanthomonadaceae bacterium]